MTQDENEKQDRVRVIICRPGEDYLYPAMSLSADPNINTHNTLTSRDELGYGDSESLYKLGKKYEEGNGVDQDYQKPSNGIKRVRDGLWSCGIPDRLFYKDGKGVERY